MSKVALRVVMVVVVVARAVTLTSWRVAREYDKFFAARSSSSTKETFIAGEKEMTFAYCSARMRTSKRPPSDFVTGRLRENFARIDWPTYNEGDANEMETAPNCGEDDDDAVATNVVDVVKVTALTSVPFETRVSTSVVGVSVVVAVD